MSNFNIKVFVIAAAVLGYAVSYHSLYLFHIVALLWLMLSFSKMACGEIFKVQRKSMLLPVLLIYLICCFSVLWHSDLMVWSRYMVYLTLGFLSLLAVYQFVTDKHTLSVVFNIVAFFVMLNFIVGFLESLNIFRYPYSPYSPYADFFGYEPLDMSSLSLAARNVVEHKPTGFNWNPNSFGFVLLLSFPFVLLLRNRVLAAALSLLFLWLFIAIGSKGHFLSLIILLMLLPIVYKLSYKKIIVVFLVMLLFSIVLLLPWFFDVSSISFPGIRRMYTAFDQVMRGISLMTDSGALQGDSTTTRASIYYFTLQNLFDSYGWGLGFGGAEAALIHHGFSITNVHFFFLQMLADLGVCFFIIFIYFYFYLAFSLISKSKVVSDPKMKYLASSSGLSLLVAVPGTLAPSGVHYILSYYILIGMSLAVLKILKMEYSK